MNMKKISFLIPVLVIATISMYCGKAPEAPKAETGAEAITAEPKGTPTSINIEKSIVKWIGTKVTGQHNGTIKISGGNIYLDGNTLTGGKFTMNMASLDNADLTGEYKEKLVGHLKSDEFFDVAKYPTAEFVITNIGEVGADGKTEITGNLKIKDITNSIKFPAKITFDSNKKPLAALANFNINRQLWKITYPGKPDDLIKDEINLDLNISL
jgi:polyisoprenoid-binding protein YceI